MFEQSQRIAALLSRYQVHFEERLSAATSTNNYEYLDILDRTWADSGLPLPEGGVGARFLVADYVGCELPAEVITAWFPFVTPAALLAWRLPLSLLTRNACSSVFTVIYDPKACWSW